MSKTERKILKDEAAKSLKSFLATGIQGFFTKAWDRLNATGVDVDLRREPTVANAQALLWIAAK